MNKSEAIRVARVAKEQYADSVHRVRPRLVGDRWVIDCWITEILGFVARSAADLEEKLDLYCEVRWRTV